MPQDSKQNGKKKGERDKQAESCQPESRIGGDADVPFFAANAEKIEDDRSDRKRKLYTHYDQYCGNHDNQCKSFYRLLFLQT